MHCLWKGERPRNAVLGEMTRCAVLYQGRVQLFGDGGEAKYILQPLLGHIWNQHPWQCVAYIKYDEVGIERYGQRAALINGACFSNLSSSIIKLTWFWGGGMDECRCLPKYGVWGHWETMLFHAVVNSWVGNTYDHLLKGKRLTSQLLLLVSPSLI